GEATNKGCRFDAGNRPQAVKHSLCPLACRIAASLRIGGTDMKCEHVLWIESWRNAPELLEAAKQQSCARQQGDRQGHLDSDQRELDGIAARNLSPASL